MELIAFFLIVIMWIIGIIYLIIRQEKNELKDDY